MSEPISKLEEQIRERINQRRKQHELISRGADWNRLCSALDVIGDTELALDAYLAHPPVEDTGTCYLHAYGALQLLQTQQDAVSSVCAALQISPKASPKIPLVRELRSAAIGHPTQQKEDKLTRSHFIVRSSLSQYAFTMFTVTANQNTHLERTVNIPDLINVQRTALTATFKEVIATLDEAEMTHQNLHKEESLASCFPATSTYHLSKIFEAVHNPGMHPLGKVNVDMVKGWVRTLRELLHKRGEWDASEGLAYELGLINYPLDELTKYFAPAGHSELNAQDAYIFASFVESRVGVLKGIAEEIDQEYQQSPEKGQ